MVHGSSRCATVRAYERIVEQIEEAIESGALQPGERLPSERELMAQFSVSRSTVREALRVLQARGLVRSRPGDPHGAEVLPFSPAALHKSMTTLARVDELSLGELVQFRMVLDASANLLAARLRTDEELAEMDAAIAAHARGGRAGATTSSAPPTWPSMTRWRGPAATSSSRSARTWSARSSSA